MMKTAMFALTSLSLPRVSKLFRRGDRTEQNYNYAPCEYRGNEFDLYGLRKSFC